MFDLETVREYIKFASLDPDLSPEEEYLFYSRYALRTREDLIQAIKEAQQYMTHPEKPTKSKTFYFRLLHMFDSFCADVESHQLIEPLDDWWGYSFYVRETGISLRLEHFMLLYDTLGEDYEDWWKYNSSHYLAADDGFTILETKSRLLSLEEYGELYHVGGGTVRQWIRRGKLRSAAKFGNEWRLPELIDKPEKGYKAAAYEWKDPIPDAPKELPDINDYDSLSIQKGDETESWVVYLYSDRGPSDYKKVKLSNKEKEKLELFLIGHPLIECQNTFIGSVHQKAGSQNEMLKYDPEYLQHKKETDSILKQIRGEKTIEESTNSRQSEQ